MTSVIAHFGVGNFHRSHQAMYLQRLHDNGLALDWHILGIGLLPADTRMRDALREQDFTYTLIERDPDGSYTAHRVNTIREYLYAPDYPEATIARLAEPDTQIVSLTITEGGYNIDDATGDFDVTNPDMIADAAPHATPHTVFGYLTSALRRRREKALTPFTVMSCDNVQGNGDIARRALTAFAGLTDPDLADWINTEVSFPNSMVDRITPATTDTDRAWIHNELGIKDPWPVISEDYTQWVLEDQFPLGRPPWENAGVQLVAHVAPYETMKLRLLNGGHQAVAYLGLLAGHTYVHEAINDPDISRFVNAYMIEAESTVPPIPGIDLTRYRQQLLQRFSNSFIRDTLARLATDASDRIPKFVVPTARDRTGKQASSPATAAVIASWVAAAEVEKRPFPPLADRQSTSVSQAINEERAAPGRFLINRAWFADLGDHPEFVSDFTTALSTLRTATTPKELRVAIQVLTPEDDPMPST